MPQDAISAPSHMVSIDLPRVIRLIRKTKLDEIPQLYNVMVGEMSLVGPRPGLKSQTELTDARRMTNVFMMKPGITGISQIYGTDMSEPVKLSKIDRLGIRRVSICF